MTKQERLQLSYRKRRALCFAVCATSDPDIVDRIADQCRALMEAKTKGKG